MWHTSGFYIIVGNVQTTRLSPAIQSEETAFIFLSESLFEDIVNEGNESDVSLFFTFYETPVLFPLGSATPPTITVGSAIIGATISGQEIQNLTDPITIFLELVNEVQCRILEPYLGYASMLLNTRIMLLRILYWSNTVYSSLIIHE